MAAWRDGYWESSDGLRLHYRDYASGEARGLLPIICIAGVTRNARDFEGVAERLSEGRRVIAVDLRGRGESAYAKDPASYVPRVYLEDVEALLAQLQFERFILFGTSLGGLLTMLIAANGKERLAGALINDIGPVIEPAGLERIRTYIGRSQSWPTWLHAARHFGEVLQVVYPKWTLEQWLVFAKRACKLSSGGRVVLDYDMRVADPFRAAGGEAGFDAWAAFRALAQVPLLALRGAHSDLLSAATLEAMQAEIPQMECVTVPNVGHAPTLDEPEAIAAIDRLLLRIGA